MLYEVITCSWLPPDDSLLTQLIGACPGSVMGTIRKLKLRHIGVVMCSVFWQEAIAVNPNALLCACWWRGTQEGSQGKPGILASRVPRGHRITSYNVCYTKLLRRTCSSPFWVLASRFVFRFGSRSGSWFGVRRPTLVC